MPTTRTVLLLGGIAALVVALTLAWRTPRTPPPAASPEAPAAATDTPRRPVSLAPEQREMVEAMAGTPPDQRQGFSILPAALADLNRVSLRSVVDRLHERARAGDAAALRRLSDIAFSCGNTLYAEQVLAQGSRSPALAPCKELTADEVASDGDYLYAAARAGDREARVRLPLRVHRVHGDTAQKKQARNDALEWLRDLARAGDPEAMIALATDAMEGRLRQPRDFVYAYACYLQALPRLHGENERKGAEHAMGLLRERLSDADIARAQARAASTTPFD